MPLDEKEKDNKKCACMTLDIEVIKYLDSQKGYNRSQACNEIIRLDMERAKKSKKKS